MIDQVLGNPLSKALAWICAGVLGLNALLGLSWLLPVTGSEPDSDASEAILGGEIPSLPAAEPIDTYSEITARPLFNESRQPIIGLAENEENEENEGEEEVVDAPEVELVGVVITPELRIATLRVKDSKEPLSLITFEGQPLEGNYGSWHISMVEPRAALLESGRGERVRLELQMHDEVIDQPPEAAKSQKASPSTQGNAAGQADDQEPATRADQIRQRIAERREELQRAAEEGQDAPRAQPPNYRSAIQNMIDGRKSQKDDESEQ